MSEPEAPEIERSSSVRPDARSQFAALPGYLSDQGVSPSHIEVVRGYLGTPRRRPEPATAPLRARPTERQPSIEDLLPRRQVLDLQPIPASFLPGSYTLADLLADRDWRKRTSDKLNRLFQ